MASIVSVEQIKGLAAGSTPNTISIPSGQTLHAPGHVIQVTTNNSTGSAISVSSQTWTDSGLSVTITPKFSNSKMVICFSYTATSTSGAQSGSGTHYKVYKSVGGSSDTVLSAFPSNGLLCYDSNSGYIHEVANIMVNDTVSSTSEHVYKLYFAQQNTGVASIQRDWGGIHMQAMEIAQ